MFKVIKDQKGSFNSKRIFFASNLFRELVKVPPGEEEDDFIATNLVDFFSRAKLLFSTIADPNPSLKTRFTLTRFCSVGNSRG